MLTRNNQSDDILSTKAFQKTSATHWRRTVMFKNRNKTYVPVFYHVNKLWVLVLVCTRDLEHTNPNSYPYYITAIKYGYRGLIS